MSVNFTVDKYRDNDTLNLILHGDLDGASAWQLINILKESCHGITRVVIQTNCLHSLEQFGYHTLIKNLYMLHRPLRIASKENDAERLILEFTKQDRHTRKRY